MRDGNKTSVITDFKYEIIKRMYETPEIIEILDCDQVDPEQPDTAEWNCIFPYIKIPGVQEKVENFIGVKVDSLGESDNPLYKDMEVIISVICATSTLQVEGQKGIRTDILGGDIVELLNGNNTFGFTFHLAEEAEGVFENRNYYYRNMRFTALSNNNSRCGVRRYQR